MYRSFSTDAKSIAPLTRSSRTSSHRNAVPAKNELRSILAIQRDRSRQASPRLAPLTRSDAGEAWQGVQSTASPLTRSETPSAPSHGPVRTRSEPSPSQRASWDHRSSAAEDPVPHRWPGSGLFPPAWLRSTGFSREGGIAKRSFFLRVLSETRLRNTRAPDRTRDPRWIAIRRPAPASERVDAVGSEPAGADSDRVGKGVGECGWRIRRTSRTVWPVGGCAPVSVLQTRAFRYNRLCAGPRGRWSAGQETGRCCR